MPKPVFSVETAGRNILAVVRNVDGMRKTVHMTLDSLEAYRMRDELERADRSAFYEGLLIGHSEMSRPT